MALHVPKAPGFAQMLKEGSRFFSGLEEAVFRNINACKQFAQTVRSAYGPNGMNKMVINHLEKLFVTSDAATIIQELEVEHPAVKIMIMSSQIQEQEIGDGTNWVIVFSGALLDAAEDLLRMGLTPTEVIEGYKLALMKSLEILPDLVCHTIKNARNREDVTKGIRTAIMSKQYGNEDFLANIIGKACVSVLPEKTTFNVDNVRVCKILGSGIHKTEVLSGMVFKRFVEGDLTKKSQAKIAVYSCPLDVTQTETKGTVLIKTAAELETFSKGEESQLEAQIKAIVESGVTVIVSGGKIGDMSLHYINKYNLMAVRLTSKWDLRRLCKACGATVLPRVTPPTPEEMGFADEVYVDELGDTSVVVFRVDSRDSRISTIVIRGSTDNLMDDIERAVDDGVNTYKGICRDGRFLPGAGATELELARQIASYGETCPGLEQYAIKKFAEALECFPKILAENSGVKGTEVVAKLYAAHQQGNKNVGFDIEGEGAAVKDMVEAGILDLFIGKHWGLKYATSAACTILQVDQIIMARSAGGPTPREPATTDGDDD